MIDIDKIVEVRVALKVQQEPDGSFSLFLAFKGFDTEEQAHEFNKYLARATAAVDVGGETLQ